MTDPVASERELAAASKMWTRATEQLAVLQLIANAGCVFLVKVDGLRTHDKLTVVLTGGVLENPFRCDGDDLATLLEAAIAYFGQHAQK